MESIYQFANITKNMAGITSSVNDLADRFENVAPRAAIDEQHIDLLVTQAQALITAANALKSINYTGG